ncbi:MAG: N-formylglutamate amidohydrolase [Promethearchaeota archaeon]|nr:MAG: N-formylglutamate amidohydrolase [Candidatus Lokiarchaeota archaeon]
MLEVRDFVEFEKGDIPLIISVPHGGVIRCEKIPERSNGIFGIDKGTTEFAKDLIKLLKINFRMRANGNTIPSYVISKIPRGQIDLNRDKALAFVHTSLLAQEIYNFYHNKIQEIIHSNLASHGRSLLIDIHGFEKKSRPPGFRDVDLILGTNNLESLFSKSIPKRDWGKNIRGKIIQKFLQLDIPIAPGHPRRREYVLTGGYITQRYGASHFLEDSKTIQIEFSDRIRIYDKQFRELVLKTLANILFENLMDV